MKLEKVLPELRKGKKIRKIGSKNYYYLENGRIKEYSGAVSMYTSFGDNCLLTDWEIVKNKKVKLRDLTEKQFTKWVKNYCTYNTTFCDNCPFKSVNCVCLNDTNRSKYKDNCRIKHKDLFSDKFLDQEVEIEEDD